MERVAGRESIAKRNFRFVTCLLIERTLGSCLFEQKFPCSSVGEQVSWWLLAEYIRVRISSLGRFSISVG